MTPRLSIRYALALILLAHALGAHAQPAPVAGEPARPVAASDADGLVSLLEFIGEFTTEDGEWVDPELMLETDATGAARQTQSGAQGDADATTEQNESCAEQRCE